MPHSTYRISMLGPRGVGKTSVLTTIYDCFDVVAAKARLRLATDPLTSPKLGDKLQQLHKICNTESSASVFDAGQGIPGDRISNLYHFYLARHTVQNPVERADLALDFYDYPGGYLTRNDSDFGDRYYEQLLESLKRSQVVVLAIDTPYLMEPILDPGLSGRQLHEARNKPDAVACALRDAFTNDDQVRLIIMAPIRCEKYMQSPDLRPRLVEAVRQGYWEMLEFLSATGQKSRFRVVVTPVETTGCVVFDHWRINKDASGGLEPAWRHNTENPQYAPMHSEQPLCHIMKFTLGLARQYRKQYSLWEALLSLFGLPGRFVDSIGYVVSRCQDDPDKGFAIIQEGP